MHKTPNWQFAAAVGALAVLAFLTAALFAAATVEAEGTIQPPAQHAAAWGSDCRFEIVPLESRFFPEQPNPAGRVPAPRTLLLDQCSGATWVLAPHGGPPEAAWLRLEREPR